MAARSCRCRSKRSRSSPSAHSGSPRNGRSEGAAVNLVTRSGTNSLHGSLYFFGRNESLNALNYFEKVENGGSGEKSEYARQQFGGALGGPVRKDRDFLFFTLERVREETAIVTDPQAFAELSLATSLGAKPARTIPTPYYDWRYNGRWDHRLSKNNNVFFSYSSQSNDGENDQLNVVQRSYGRQLYQESTDSGERHGKLGSLGQRGKFVQRGIPVLEQPDRFPQKIPYAAFSEFDLLRDEYQYSAGVLPGEVAVPGRSLVHAGHPHVQSRLRLC